MQVPRQGNIKAQPSGYAITIPILDPGRKLRERFHVANWQHADSRRWCLLLYQVLLAQKETGADAGTGSPRDGGMGLRMWVDRSSDGIEWMSFTEPNGVADQ